MEKVKIPITIEIWNDNLLEIDERSYEELVVEIANAMEKFTVFSGLVKTPEWWSCFGGRMYWCEYCCQPFYMIEDALEGADQHICPKCASPDSEWTKIWEAEYSDSCEHSDSMYKPDKDYKGWEYCTFCGHLKYVGHRNG